MVDGIWPRVVQMVVVLSDIGMPTLPLESLSDHLEPFQTI